MNSGHYIDRDCDDDDDISRTHHDPNGHYIDQDCDDDDFDDFDDCDDDISQ